MQTPTTQSLNHSLSRAGIPYCQRTLEDAARVANILYEPEPKLYSVEEMNDVLARLGYRTQEVQDDSDILLNRDLQGMIWARREPQSPLAMDRIAP